MKYRKKPIVIEAIQWTGKNHQQVLDFTTEASCIHIPVGVRWFLIPTLEGIMRADINDWIIRGIKGEYYACKPDIFEATYEAVAD